MNCRLLFGLLGCLFVASGCASWRTGPFGEPSTPTTRKPTGKSEQVAEASRSASRLTTPPGTVAGKSVTQKPDTAAKPQVKPASKSDQATQEYIANELRDASPAERAEFQRLAQVDPTMAQLALRGRRMGLSGKPAESAVATAAINAAAINAATTATKADLADGGHGPATPPLGDAWSPARTRSQTARDENSVTSTASKSLDHPESVPTDRVAAHSPAHDERESGVTQVGNEFVASAAPGAEHAPATPTASARADLVPGKFDAPPRNSQIQPVQHQVAGTAMQAKKSNGLISKLPVLQDLMPKGAAPVEESSMSKSRDAGPMPHLAEDWRDSTAYQTVLDSAARDVANQKLGPDSDPDAYLQKQVHLRMLYLMNGQAERAVESIPGVEPADQIFWQQTFWGMHNYFDTKIASREDRATQTVQHFTTAAQRLQENANLQLRNVSFCEQISSFGSYERFPQYEFSPGQQVLLYGEVENFHSEQNDQGQFRTILKSTVEIYRAGLPGDPQKIELPVPATEDICKNRRRDYFHTYEFVIPQRMAPGPHVLRLTVEDTLTHKIAASIVNFTVK